MPDKKKTVLHEVIAVEDSKKKSAERLLGEATKQFKDNRDRYEGFTRKYEPYADGGEQLPEEKKSLEDTVLNKLDYMFQGERDFVDVSLTKEKTNQFAVADIEVNGNVIATGLPATALLFLEKRTKRWLDVLNALPVLDPAEQWAFNDQTDCYVSKERATVREKKDLKWQVITDATKEHKAQYESWTETSPVGNWIKKRFSGAVSVKDKAEMIQRVKILYEAIVSARMRANMQEIMSVRVAKDLVSFVLGQSKAQ